MKTVEHFPKCYKGIIAELQEFVLPNSKILDIGCGYGHHLFPFVDFNPSKLIGIDNNPLYSNHIFRNFLYNRNNLERRLEMPTQSIDFDEEDKPEDYWRNLFPEQAEIFRSKFDFIIDKEKGDVENFNLGDAEYEIIIASDVLHFFEPSREEAIIDRIVKGTKKSGKIYISVNRFEKIDFERSPYNTTKKLNDDCVISYDTRNPQVKWYLYTDTGIKKLIEKFPKLIKTIESNGIASAFIFEK